MTYKIAISSKSMSQFLDYIGECPVASYQYKWKILDSTYYLYKDYIYSTKDIAKMLVNPDPSIRKMANARWFKQAGIDCIRMWSRLRFSEEGFRKLKMVLDRRLYQI